MRRSVFSIGVAVAIAAAVGCTKTVTVSVPNERATSNYSPYSTYGDQDEGHPITTGPVEVPRPYVERPVKGTEKIDLFFIALGDNGKQGPVIGCGDSVVPVKTVVSSSQSTLKTAIQTLLDIEAKTYGPGFYNALYQSRFRLKRLAVKDNRAIVDLSGDLKLGGECDAPRVEAQLRKTVLQFSHIVDVTLTLNGLPLAHALSYSGKPL